MFRDSKRSKIFLERLSVDLISPIPRRVQRDQEEEDKHRVQVDEDNSLFVSFRFFSLFTEIVEGNILL